ncbi:MAG: hypothetical protein NC914_03545, partial [Candidatus Omnitrophica bacterium]|nr:hypothetical protein [Candidatus Omnitrophota bacterium]
MLLFVIAAVLFILYKLPRPAQKKQIEHANISALSIPAQPQKDLSVKNISKEEKAMPPFTPEPVLFG